MSNLLRQDHRSAEDNALVAEHLDEVLEWAWGPGERAALEARIPELDAQQREEMFDLLAHNDVVGEMLTEITRITGVEFE